MSPFDQNYVDRILKHLPPLHPKDVVCPACGVSEGDENTKQVYGSREYGKTTGRFLMNMLSNKFEDLYLCKCGVHYIVRSRLTLLKKDHVVDEVFEAAHLSLH